MVEAVRVRRLAGVGCCVRLSLVTVSSEAPQGDHDDQQPEIRFIRDLDAEPKVRRDALMAAVDSMLDDDRELRRSA
jgi:hypothetical protein